MEIENHLTNNIIHKLVFALREHEETTKEDIISCLGKYLRSLTVDEVENTVNNNFTNINNIQITEDFGLVRKKSNAQSIIPVIFKELLDNTKKILTSQNTNILLAGLNLLNSLVLPASKETILNLEEIKANIYDILKKNSSNFNLLLFQFFNRILKAVSFDENVIPHLDTLIDWMILGLRNDYYIVNIEGAHMAAQLVRILKETLAPEDFLPKISLINKEILPKFISNDLDKDLKASLISSVGNIIFFMVEYLDSSTLGKFFEVFLDKFKNENLVILCSSWIMKILKRDIKIESFNTILYNFIPVINELINKKQSSLRNCAVEFLSCIIQFYPFAVQGSENILIQNLLNYSEEEGFIQILFETLNLFVQNFKLDKLLILQTIKESIKIIENAKINLSDKEATSFLYYNASASELLTDEELQKLINSILNGNYLKLNQIKSKLIAFYAKNANYSENFSSVLINDLNKYLSSKPSENSIISIQNILVLLGDLALINIADNSEGFVDALFNLTIKFLKSENDDIKPNAALMLAKVGVCNTSNFMKFIKQLTEDSNNIRYALSSLREFIHLICETEKKNFVKFDYLKLSNEVILEFRNLLQPISNPDDKISKVCGECLALLSGKCVNLLDKYIEYLDDGNEHIRSGFYFGLKSLNYIKDEIWLSKIFDKLVKGLADPAISVKQNAYNSLISFSHEYSHIFKLKFAEIWDHFENDFMIKPELISEVDIGGGMRIKNDKGLPIRKAIFSTIKILIQNIPEKIHYITALQMLIKGLGIT